jgi:hypothetical protein
VSWAEEELTGIDLGDNRLNKRAIKLLEDLSSQPSTSIPARCHGWAETTAAYRFMSNERVNDQNLIAPHILSTRERMRTEKVVLCIEDTTELDFTGHKAVASQFGPMGQSYQRGMFLHLMLATTPERVPLGVLNAAYHIRPVVDPKDHVDAKEKAKERAKQDIEDKESYRWVTGYEAVNEMAKKSPGQLVYVTDREGDIEEVLKRAQGQPAALLIRAKHDRIVEDGDRMWDIAWNTPVLGTAEFLMSARPGRTARVVRQSIRSATITLPETKKREKAITFNVVIAHEDNPPEGEDPVSWTLLTTLPVATAEEALLIVELYLCRWDIEMFFKVLKSGCAVQELQLETVDRLKIAISLSLIIAHRVLMMSKLGRDASGLPCDVIFDDIEWKIVYRYHHKKMPPKDPPLLGEIVRILAMIGGFLGRKSDGFPGSKTIWRGLSTIHSYLRVNEEINGNRSD